jgi:DNA invertase Pin-like site-specific DNA recombinase
MTHPKLKPAHLSRNAYVYVRQSTQHQVQHHLESQQRQYELQQFAQGLGFTLEHVIVIDDDLGVSASGQAARAGFERLVSDVALGRAGLVLGLEVSRLARNNRDWYELLDLCALRDTLIGDADGIYDPSTYNDRLLLGLKGTMSEAELHILRARMLAGMHHKAEKGELRFRLPPGYEFSDDGTIVKTNDEQIAQFIELLFDKLFELGSISGLTKYLLHEGLKFPRRERSDGGIRWEHPYYRAVFTMITNPIYAGTYAYGRSETITNIDARGSRRNRRRHKAMADWDVVLHDHHAAYISRETFQRVQLMVARNRPSKREQASTALREGAALLQGIVRCGHCGRAMTVRYHGRAGGRSVPHYGCMAALAQRRAGVCQSMGGHRIDQAISRVFLDTLAGAQLDAQLLALRQLDTEQDAVLQQLELQRQRATFEAGRIERQYNAVEPENRVVARTLETRWNDALSKLSELDIQVADRKQLFAQKLSDAEHRQLQELAAHLPRLWSHEKLTDRDRKALIRAAIEEVQLCKEERTVNAKVIWKGGAISEMSIQLIKLAPPPPTPPDLVSLIRELAKRYSDAQIAGILVRRRIKTPKKHVTFTARHVNDLRRSYDVPPCPAPVSGAAAAYTVEQTARLFEVGPPTVYHWLKLGILVGEQVTPQAPWQIQITDADRARLMSQPPAGWLTLPEAARELAVSKQTLLNWVKARKIAYVYVVRGRRSGLRFDVNSAPQRKQQRLLD